jgi:DNA-binding response OmpR family regulator
MSASRGTVLIVEDDLVLQQALGKFLGLHRFAVASASTVDEALDIVRRDDLAAAVVDLNLPHGTGRDVVVSIPQPVPVIIFSGMPAESCDLERLRPNTRLIAKPYSLTLLVEALEGMLGQRP